MCMYVCATNGCSTRIYHAISYFEIASFLNGGINENRGVATDRARTFIYITVLITHCVDHSSPSSLSSSSSSSSSSSCFVAL